MIDTVDLQNRQSVGVSAEGQNPAGGKRTREQIGKRVVETHRRRLRSRQYRDATAEKYALHVDGEGEGQWHDLYRGQRMLMVPRLRGAPRMQNNQLRPIVDNLIAHLTTQPLRFVVESRKDKDSRERALMDQMIVNYHVRKQHWNALLAEAKYTAACYGFCPLHQMVRDDVSEDYYEGTMPSGAGEGMDPQQDPMMQQEMGDPPRIQLDAWVGNPWDMTFDSGARLWSIHRCTYGRVLPTELVQAAFNRPDIEGDSRRPSASQFQLIVQRWMQSGSAIHGTASLHPGQSHEELTGLVCEEIPPGILSEPAYRQNGRLRIVVLHGASTAQREVSQVGGGRAELLWEGELPGGTFSWVPFYSHNRMDDVLGKPFVADLDEDQIVLNQLESLADEYLRRASRPPLASSGAVDVSTLDYHGDSLLTVEPTGPAGQDIELRYLEYPAQHLVFLQARIARVLEGMARKGAFQAASRGEGKSGESGKAIIALQTADDSILGPLAMRTKSECEEFAKLSWKLLKEYLDMPMVVDIVGDELAHIAEPYVDRHMLSKEAPTFKLVSGFGTSTEAKAQQLLNLFGLSDAAGEEVLTARQLRHQWPDQTLFGEQEDPAEYRERHARVVNQSVERVAEEIRQAYPGIPEVMNDPTVMQLAMWGWQALDQRHPLLMDDDPPTHIETLSLLTQDDTQDALVRHIAMLRQDQYWQWIAQQQEAAAAAQAGQPAEPGAMQPPTAGGGGGGNLPATQREGGTPGAQSMVQQDRQFSQHANQVRSA